MRIPRIYTEQTLAADTCIALEAGPSQHLSRALRMQTGDALILFNGQGGEFHAQIEAIERKQVRVNTGKFSEVECESALQIHLGIAVSRGDRMDWVVQKATELGVTSLSPLFTERTEVKLAADRADKKRRHWQQIAISACEQCGRNRLPIVHPPKLLDAWLADTRADAGFVLHHRTDASLSNISTPASIALLVGPEGGLSEAEITAAQGYDYQPLQLGPRVLRTETAPLASIAILQARWGDM